MAVTANGEVLVADNGNARVEEFTASGTFLTIFGAGGTGEGQFEAPTGIAAATAGGIYVADASANRVEQWAPAITGNAGAHETKTIYYTAKTEAKAKVCRTHPEWVGLPCETTPVAQPGTSGLPELPISTIEYNTWNQPETVEETFGTGAEAKTRKKRTMYDAAGRPTSTEETSTVDTAFPRSPTNTASKPAP